MIDIILDGFDYVRSAMIVSDISDEISKAIMDKLSQVVTALKGRGFYKNIDRDIIMAVITRREVIILEDIIKEIDSNAFVVINTVHEVLGEGFRRRA